MRTPLIPKLVAILSVLLLVFAGTTVAQDKPPTARLTGRVVDARSGEPLAKVKVIASGTDQETTTDDNGKFAIDRLKPGKIDLYITTVTYGLVKKTVVLHAGDNSDLQIALNEDAAALTENVTVNTAPFESSDNTAINQQVLNKRELQQLSSVLLSDPIRAAQALPGVSANDDYRSEFSVRGAGFDRVGLYLDGVLTENFLHLVAGGYRDTGSVSVINADTVDTLALMSGGFPASYGYRSAAALDIQTRNGNRVKPNGRIQAALTGLAGTADGPFANKRGSYLIAARKSFTGYLVRRFNDEFHYTNNPPVVDVADIHTKAIYDLSKRSQIGASVIFGNFDFDRNRDRDLLGSNQVFQANNKNLLVNGHWTFTRDPHFFVQTRLFALRTTFKNTNRDDHTLDDGHRTQFGVRSDLNYQVRQHHLEAGLYLRHLRVRSFNQQFDFFGGPLFVVNNYDRNGVEQSYYVQDNWRDEKRRLSLTGGLRVEHSSVTRETNFSPRAAFAWSIDDKWKVSAAAGRYYQFPDFEQIFGFFANRNLKSERATHFSASVERLLGNRARIFAEIYDREDRKLFFSFDEPTLVQIVRDQRFQNSVSGHARGIELTLQRRSANKLAGWISYAYSKTRLTESRSALTFPSDFDQRHTLNVYGNYRFADTWNFSSEWRYGSGQPIPGFYGQDAAGYFLTTQRNQVRVPYYSRVDLRLTRAFLFKKAKLTLTGEVLNLLNRENQRFVGFDFFSGNGRVFGQLDRILPIFPSAGVVIEF